MNCFDYFLVNNISTPLMYCTKAPTLSGKSLEYFSDGIVALERFDINRMFECFSSVLRLEPDSFEAMNNVGNVLVAAGKIADATTIFMQGIRKFPREMTFRYNYGTMLLLANQLKDAGDQLEQALSLSPNHFATKNNLALVCGGMKNEKRCKELLEQVLTEEGSFVAGLHDAGFHNLALLLYREKRFEEAIALFDRALAIAPRNIYTLNDIACCYYCQGEREKAVSFFQKAFSVNSRFRPSCYNYGFVVLSEERNAGKEGDITVCCGSATCSDDALSCGSHCDDSAMGASV